MRKEDLYSLKPRERLIDEGADRLSIQELIALVLGNGTQGVPVMDLAHQVLTFFGDLEALSQATVEEFCQIKGIGKAKAVQLKAAISLGMRVEKRKGRGRCKIENPSQAYNIVKSQLEHETREVMCALLLDVKGWLIRTLTIAIGTLSKSLVHPREVFYPAIRHKAASLILVHNHPSGDPTPSQADIETTQQLVEVGKVMRIPVNDHLVIGANRFISIRQQGIICFA